MDFVERKVKLKNILKDSMFFREPFAKWMP